MENQSNKRQGMEIDIIGISKKILNEKKLLIRFIIGFVFLGVVVALSTPKLYTSEVVLAPEIDSSIGISGNISDVASMVGLDIGGISSMDAIHPDIYPDIFASNDFIVQLFDVPVATLKNDVTKNYYDHLEKDTKTPFWSYPGILIQKLIAKFNATDISKEHVGPVMLSKKQEEICKTIKKNISCLIDKKTNVITIAVTDEDPLVAAIMADTLQNRLQQYIMLYRTKKARADVKYAETLYKESKEDYEKAQQRYASYVEAYTNTILQSYISKQEKLENELQLKLNTYNQITQQLQHAKAKVQERTPAFTIIQNAYVPLKASSIPRSFIVLLFAVLGIFADALWILYLRNFIQKRKE